MEKMDKKTLSRIMAKSPREDIIALADSIRRRYSPVMIKRPAKTLVMVTMREPVANGRFYLGEVLASEAIVKIEDKPGIAVSAGDDFDKVTAMAVIDAAMNACIQEVPEILETLSSLSKRIFAEEQQENKRNLRSKVDFTMVDGV